MTRQAVAEGVDARTAVDVLRGFRSVVDVSVYASDQAAANWRPLTLAERRTVWSFRDRSTSVQPVGPDDGAEARRKHE